MTVVFTVIAAVFGISFGTLCVVPYVFVFGIEYAIAWVLSGIGFDVIHCIGNAVSTAVLFYPIYWLLKSCKKMLIRA
jgi:energy-coupling factor transport system substrate-specific component